jgi:hypothetical protein
MRILRKTLWRMLLASLLLALPRVALASPAGASSGDHWLYGIIDGMSQETLENLIYILYLGGCTS